MQITFRKQSQDRHQLTIEHADGRRESMSCETRSYLLHDFLHYAVESAAGLEIGFWGTLALGGSLADLNAQAKAAAELAKRAGASQLVGAAHDLAVVERVVGAMHGATKGVPAAELLAGIRRYETANDSVWPPWLTEPFMVEVVERMRKLRGQWAATRFGESMTLSWPPK